MTSGIVLYIMKTFPLISVLGTAAFPSWRTSMTICFWWSSLLVMNFLVWTVTVSVMVVANLQAAREEKKRRCYLNKAL